MSPSGKPRAKYTFRALLPEFRVGDTVAFGGRTYYVLAIESGTMRALMLERMREVKLKVSKALIESSEVVCRKEEAIPVIVLSAREGEIQVMTLGDYKVISLEPNSLFHEIDEGDDALLVDAKGNLYVVPRL